MIHSFIGKTEDDGKYYMFEGLIKGEYVKYTNNWIFFNNKNDIRLFTAFSHFTWNATSGNYLVTDL